MQDTFYQYASCLCCTMMVSNPMLYDFTCRVFSNPHHTPSSVTAELDSLQQLLMMNASGPTLSFGGDNSEIHTISLGARPKARLSRKELKAQLREVLEERNILTDRVDELKQNLATALEERTEARAYARKWRQDCVGMGVVQGERFPWEKRCTDMPFGQTEGPHIGHASCNETGWVTQ